MKGSILVKNHLKIREDSNYLIVSTKDHNILFLDEVSKDFYLKIDGEKELETIIHELLLIYEVELEILINDIIDLVRKLQWKNILREI